MSLILLTALLYSATKLKWPWNDASAAWHDAATACNNVSTAWYDVSAALDDAATARDEYSTAWHSGYGNGCKYIDST